MAGARRVRRPPAVGDKRPGQVAEVPAGLEEEIEILRGVIRELAEKQDVKEARRQIDTLCRVLRTRYTLDDRAMDVVSATLLDVLVDLGLDGEGEP